MIFKNYPLIGVTYLKIGFNKSLKNIKNTDKMVYTNEENTLTEITSESVSERENKLCPILEPLLFGGIWGRGFKLGGFS